jgi:hypothetical protein
MFHQGEGTHVIVGAHHQAAECVHECVVTVTAVARSKQVLDESLQALVRKALVKIRYEFFLLARADRRGAPLLGRQRCVRI